ncbi:girdin isoform X2 [Condylostylus longicornis]|uniref:girdin isoform X2 n=1 Tax=Condylostylus longicornis TaxID=2530218 RepID=UPI00244E1E2C|nr:girdin isoform X2 [Condylostylus longicornis]
MVKVFKNNLLLEEMDEIEDFLNGALVSWLESCLPRPEILSGYQSLLDGSIVHSVWLQIDPEPTYHPLNLTNLEGLALATARAKNFDVVIRNLKSLYEEELGQTILNLPDCYILGFNPETRSGLEQMKLLLILLLGAAVQCPNKEIFIARIKELDVNTQHGIVELIKQVTDNHSLVLTQESVEVLTPSAMYNHIIRLTKERDNIHSKWICSLITEPEVNLIGSESVQSTPLSPVSGIGTTSTASTESNHMAVELADLKSKLRKLRQELEEKSEAYLEVKEELEHKNVQYEKLRSESQEWYTEAKRAAAYRDEVDVLRERAERADHLEIEVQKFREKLTDAEFYRSRVEELREDNRMLMETKEMLEDQLQRSRKRSEHVMSLESEIIKYKQKLNDMALERDVDRTKLQEVLEENTQLQLVAKNLNSTHEIDHTISENEDDCNSGDNSLSEQLTTSAQTRALKLELENRRLLAALDQLKESSFHESTNKILELEKEKKRLSLKLDQLTENSNRLTQQNKELEDVFKNALEENKKLQDAIDLRQKVNERQSQEREIERAKLVDLEKLVESLSKEKQRIQNLNESIQRRADDLDRILDMKIKEVEQLNEKSLELDRTKNQIYELEIKFNTMERENTSLTKEVTKLKENLEMKSVQLDKTSLELETQSKEVMKLRKDIEKLEINEVKVLELEKQNQELTKQREIDLQTIDTLRNDLVNGTLATNKVKQNLEKLGIDNSDIENGDLNVVESVVEKLVKNPETFKTVREIMLNVTRNENNKSDMCVLCHRKEIFTVEKNIEISASHDEENQEISEISSIENFNTKNEHFKTNIAAKWKEQCEQLCTTNQSLQNSNELLQAENARLNVDVATLGSQITSLNTQHVALQLANSQLAADKDVLLKQVDSVKMEHKNLLHDQITLQCLHDQLSSEYESLNKDKEALKTVIRDLRNENRESKERASNLEKMVEELQVQMSTMKSSIDDSAILRAEHSKLTDDFRNLFATSDRFKNEYKNLQKQYKMIRAENARLILQNTELSGELNLRIDQVKSLEIEYTKVSQRCEMLLHQNSNLDIDRRTLMDNVSQLLSQYHELLTHSLEDKQHYHDEEKNFTDKVNSLNRQKEKLEEKIMETYKKSESCAPKKKPFGSSFVKRVKKASSDLMNKVPSRNRRSWIDDSRLTQSQFALGSESGGNESDNSTEEQNSIASDTHLIQRNAPMRQSLQRITNETVETAILRGGIRSSLQSHKRSDLSNTRRNSVHGLEAPDVTGSSLTLGTAGSRRTVYLIDENQKLPDSQTPTPEAQTPTNPTTISSTGTSTVSSTGPSSGHLNGNNSSLKNDAQPSTFVMYNRINTMIGGSTNETPSDAVASGFKGNGTQSGDEKSLTKKRNDDKASSIWYEYGCV